ncbi:hydroxyethylthiazole kinase [Belliella baltica DSM 15883]|uniref:Hydroxyethylthiazole kinase n=1 Tax=Belliella baltica (strain DSM 15883 / CIP 108006 / LMG 21964 / BA134) TaxID=866536 RepID=I3Z8V6_BELBD|nr:hydroxyethylthiazole kinase [Belliella baltica]AFL85674.1 hydroxyethylthiazole kinase [Belliella baltica DSM 15883]
MKELISNTFRQFKSNPTLVQNITNYVVMNNTANALLAVGASPIMSHAHPEQADMVRIISSLVINIGTLDEYWAESMLLAAEQANLQSKPWVLDPVGAGATPYRNEILSQLLLKKPTVIRGNASEIMSLASVNVQSKGVDSSNSSDEALQAGIQLSKETEAVVCISGAKDYIIHNDKIATITNGSPLMAKVTGMGCTASAIVGAFVGLGKDPFLETLTAMAVMGVAGDLAADMAIGPGTLQLYFYDALYNLTEEELEKRVQASVI